MAKRTYNQCLLFVIHKKKQETRNSRSSADQLVNKGFLLLSRAFRTKCPQICELFLQNGLQIIDNHNFLCLNNSDVEVMELLLSGVTTRCLVIYTEKCNGEQVSLLFSPSVSVSFRSDFNPSKIRSALDQEGLSFMKRLLTDAANIRLSPEKSGTLLHLATERRNEPLVKLLVKHGSNVNAQRNDGSTPLHIATKKKLLKVIQFLIKNGAQADVQMLDGSTPLHIAADKGHIHIVKCLLQNGANINSTMNSGSGQSGFTPLHISIKEGHQEIVKLLLEKGGNVNAECNSGKSCLHFAVDKGSLEIIKSILKYRPDVNNESNKRAFRDVLFKGDEELLEVVSSMDKLGFTLNPEDYNKALLTQALFQNDIELVRHLLESHVNINEILSCPPGAGYTPLYLAVAFAGPDVIKLLLDFGATLNFESEQHLISSKIPVNNKISEGIEFFSQNDTNFTIASIAIRRDMPEILEILLQQGLDPNSQDTSSGTAACETLPLICAVSRDCLKSIKILLKYGARIKMQSGDKRHLVLLVAATKRHLQAFKTLLDFGFTDSNFTEEKEIMCIFSILGTLGMANDEALEFKRTFARHLLKMEAANVYVGEVNISALLAHSLGETWLCKSLDEFKAEIMRLKSETVGDSNFTFYDFLNCNVDRVACLLRNDTIAKMVTPENYELLFPNYAGIINWQLERGAHRKNLLQQSLKVCSVPSNKLKTLPYEVLETILNYLNDRELILYINSFSTKNPAS